MTFIAKEVYKNRLKYYKRKLNKPLKNWLEKPISQ